MKATIITLVVVVVIVLVGGGIYLAARNNSNTSNPVTTQNQSGQNNKMKGMDMSSNGSESTAPAATNSVTIENFAFSPANITVKKGTAVTWVNKDSTPHTVTENDGQTGPDSGTMAKDGSYTFTFNTVGKFQYHCTFHPNMVGTVTVTE